MELVEVWAQKKFRRIVEARSVVCFWAVKELGMSLSSLARKLRLSIPSVIDSVARGQSMEMGDALHNSSFCEKQTSRFVIFRALRLTDEELDFILNYDIKYRMGQDSSEGEEE